jgi:hypothetical protein
MPLRNAMLGDNKEIGMKAIAAGFSVVSGKD